ncbi:MAG: NlpC/P60 family protein [Desulfatitalea sp.]
MDSRAPGKTPVRVWLLLAMWIALFGLSACGAPKEPLLQPQPPIPAPAPPEAAPVSQGSALSPGSPNIAFTIQVGAFSEFGRAAAFAERLQAAGVDAYYFIDRDGMYKVRFERFETLPEAQQRALALRAMGLIQEFYIVQPAPLGSQPNLPGSFQESIVSTAHRFLGKPYRYGKASQQEGFDCSGLTMTVFRLNGLELPRSAADQFNSGKPVARDALQSGDLVFFATGRSPRISHVGIYSGQGQFIHAATRDRAVRVSSLSNGYFKNRYKGARRYF